MLPLLATLFFALIGIGALIVDGGLALTEQARLETTAEMVTNEWMYVQSNADQWPTDCTGSPSTEIECLQRSYLAPLLDPLGVELSETGVPGGAGSPWRRSHESLDGSAIDPRGVRLGEVNVQGVLDGGDPSSITLARSSPLLFGWATIAPENASGASTSVADLQNARASQGLAPDLGGTGLRGAGFELSANEALDLGGAPALWVGPPMPNPGGRAIDPRDDFLTSGLVGLAWRRSQLAALEPVLGDASGGAALFEVDADRLRASSTGDEVACLFEVPGTGAHVGQRIADWPPASAAPAIAPMLWSAAYVAVVEDCAPDQSAILGFLELEVDARSASALTLRRGRSLRPNAAPLPPYPAAASAAYSFWRSAEDTHGEFRSRLPTALRGAVLRLPARRVGASL